ncbi:MAG: DUF929 family protein [Candidatus Dormibacteria bacterium]
MARPSRRRRQELSASGSPASGRPAPARAPSPTPSRYRTQRVKLARPWWQTPWTWGGGITVVVIAVVVVFIVLANQPAKSSSPSAVNQPVPASVLAAVTGVSPVVSSSIGAGGLSSPLEQISGSPAPLTGSGGEPQLFYLGAEYCPYCAAQRWSVVIALSRFGTFSNLHLTMSDTNASDFPDTHSFTFYGSSYTSSYLDFAPVETADRSGNPLQTPTAAQQALATTYDTAPYSSQDGGIPFMDLANRFIVSGTAVDVQLLQGMTWQQIAATLTSAQSQVAKQIIGNANWLTAGICKVTDGQPGSVCSSAPISTLEGQLGSS